MKILYFYQENPLVANQGNNARALGILKYFKERNFTVDFVGEKSTVFDNYAVESLKEQQLIANGYLLKDFKRKKNQIKYFFCYSLPNKILKKIKDFDRTRFGQINNFNEILKNNSYDFVIISYAYWSRLVQDNKYIKKARLVIDTHDFLTSQFQINKNFELSKYFEKEIQLLNFFDEVVVISNEENYLFSQFVKGNVITITHCS